MVSDQMYAGYAEGVDLRGLAAIVGQESLSEKDKRFLEFGNLFENRYLSQGKEEDRSITDTLDLAWELLSTMPSSDLSRLDEATLKEHYKEK